MQNDASKGYLARDGVGVAFGNILYAVDIENPVPAEGFEVD